MAIEIDEIVSFPINSMVIFHGYVNHNQMVNPPFSKRYQPLPARSGGVDLWDQPTSILQSQALSSQS